MKSKSQKHVKSLLAHIVLIILAFMCLFFFYILIINSTRSHADLQKDSQHFREMLFWIILRMWRITELSRCSKVL